MAEIDTDGGGKKGHGGKKPKQRKMNPRVDMTPMVDLGFLLITFFILTTSLITPQTMEISVPSRDKVENPPAIKQSLAITILPVGNDVVYYYFGEPKDAQLIKADYSAKGLRKMLLERNANVTAKVLELKKKRDAKEFNDSIYKKKVSEAKADVNSPMVLIKASNKASYKNLVDVLDEMQICNVGRYSIVDISAYELQLLQKKGEVLDEAEQTLVSNL